MKMNTMVRSATTQPFIPLATDNNTISSHSDRNFKIVRRGAKLVHHVIHSTICCDKFQVLRRDESANSFLVGDSMTHHQ